MNTEQIKHSDSDNSNVGGKVQTESNILAKLRLLIIEADFSYKS